MTSDATTPVLTDEGVVDARLIVVHSVGSYWPVSTGGTEIFVADLARALDQQSIRNVILAPGDVTTLTTRRVEEVDVVVYPRDHRNRRVHFKHALQEVDADIYHHHGWQPDLNDGHLQIARDLGCRCVLTLHTSFSYCMRQDFLLFGREPCRAPLTATQCTQCFSQYRGAGRRSSQMLRVIPGFVGQFVEKVPLKHSLMTAIGVKHAALDRRRRFHHAVKQANKVTVFTHWQADLLDALDVPVESVNVIRHGIDSRRLLSPERTVTPVRRSARVKKRLRCVFVGRITQEKGLDVLLEAWRLLERHLPVSLEIFGPLDVDHSAPAVVKMQTAIRQDDRIVWRGTLDPNDVVVKLRDNADVLLVPSRWMETGPLVVLESFAAGVPVFGANRGGIAELVTDGKDGRLLPADQPEAWAEAIRCALHDVDVMEHYRQMVRKPRSMSDVAGDFSQVYAEITQDMDSQWSSIGGSVGHHPGVQRGSSSA